MAIRVRLDVVGCRQYERSHWAMDETRRKAEELAHKASANLMESVQHTHPVTPPPAATAFAVQRTATGYAMVNHDPAIIFLEYGFHPGGAGEEVRYSPIRRALDRMEMEHE